MWGTGTPRREFLHVDDLADACLFLMEHYDGDDHINVGTGEDLSIRELAEQIRDIVAPMSRSRSTRPSRTAHHASCSTSAGCIISVGATGSALREGLASTYEWFCAQVTQSRALVSRGGGPYGIGVDRVRLAPLPLMNLDSSLAERSQASDAAAYSTRRIAHWDASPARGRAGAALARGVSSPARARLPVPRSRAGCACSNLGCGDGDLLAVARAGEGVGVDFSPAWSSRRGAGIPDLHFVDADAHDLSQLGGPFDVIVLSDLLHDVWDVQELLDRSASPVSSGHARRHELLQPAVGAAA